MAPLLGAAFIAMDFAFAPWAFFLGGRTHLLPLWEGTGRMQTSSGIYTLYLWMSPTPGGSVTHLPSLSGQGRLCTPRGERFDLQLVATLYERTGTSTNGKGMSLKLYRRLWYYGLVGQSDHRPRLEFDGRWQNPDLVMDDGGSLSQAFLPDATAYLGPVSKTPAAREHVSVMFHEMGLSAWFPACRAG